MLGNAVALHNIWSHERNAAAGPAPIFCGILAQHRPKAGDSVPAVLPHLGKGSGPTESAGKYALFPNRAKMPRLYNSSTINTP
jgi:hypothetical protein